MFDWLFGRRTREEQLLVDMMKSAGEGHRLAQLRTALSTIGVSLPDQSVPAVATAASSLALDLAKRAGSAITDTDCLYVSGLFTFGAANCFSYRCGVPFEQSASLAVMMLVGSNPQEFERVHPAMVRDFNAMATENSETHRAIGTTIASWEASPSRENYARLTALFALCLKHAKH